MEERRDENLNNKVNAMIREGMKLRDITAKSCRRIPVREGGNGPGVIIVECQSLKDKKAIMKAKLSLRKARAQYKDIRISHDYSPQERATRSNLRLIQQSIGDKNIELHSMRFVKVKNTEQEGRRSQSREDDKRDRSSHDRSPQTSQSSSSRRSPSLDGIWEKPERGKGKWKNGRGRRR